MMNRMIVCALGLCLGGMSLNKCAAETIKIDSINTTTTKNIVNLDVKTTVSNETANTDYRFRVVASAPGANDIIVNADSKVTSLADGTLALGGPAIRSWLHLRRTRSP